MDLFSYAFGIATKGNLHSRGLIVELKKKKKTMPKTCGAWDTGQDGKHNGYNLVVCDCCLKALFKTCIYSIIICMNKNIFVM